MNPVHNNNNNNNPPRELLSVNANTTLMELEITDDTDHIQPLYPQLHNNSDEDQFE